MNNSDKFGLESINIQMSEQQLTDQISFVVYDENFNVLDKVQGKYLDYDYDLVVEEIEEDGTRQEIKCMYDVDELLYTPITYTTLTLIEYDSLGEAIEAGELDTYAEAHLTKIANAIGKTLVKQFDNFQSTMALNQEGKTYQGLISELFGWTGDIPSMMINCYIRKDKMYVIQHGHEENLIDITNLERTRPVRTKKVMRTIRQAPEEQRTETSKARTTYNWGAWQQISGGNNENNFGQIGGYKSGDKYQYSDEMLQSKESIDDEGRKIKNLYFYTTIKKKKYLSHEQEIHYDAEGQIEKTINTYHNYLKNGQHITTVYETDEDGQAEYKGSTVSWTGGDSNEKRTEYEKRQENEVWQRSLETDTATAVIASGIILVEKQFPVKGQALQAIVDEFENLNRKTQENIKCDIYNYEHIIDFNDKVKLEENEYFLVSNTVVKTPRIVNKQSIEIVRWY